MPNFLQIKLFSINDFPLILIRFFSCIFNILYLIKPADTENPGPEVFSASPLIFTGFPNLTLVPKYLEAKSQIPFNKDRERKKKHLLDFLDIF